MIRYLVNAEHDYAVGALLGIWARELMDIVRVWPYEQALGLEGPLEPGVYVFSDFDRLNPADLQRAVFLADRLEASEGCRVVTHPGRALMRFDLLARLTAEGLNDFSAWRYRIGDPPPPARYPVFLRREHQHDGPATGLIQSPEEIEPAARALTWGHDDLMVIEFVDTRDPDLGLYRKYSAFRVGKRIFPRHLLFGRDWVLKVPKADAWEAARLAEEMDYLKTDPHHEAVARIFDMAGIEWGRMDYAFDAGSGRMQVWEINSNPVILQPRDEIIDGRMPGQTYFAERMAEAVKALDRGDI